jgi:hypothetical protein
MDLADKGNGRGSGSALHPAILLVAATSTAVATVVSATSIFMHLKNYRKPTLQRLVTSLITNGLDGSRGRRKDRSSAILTDSPVTRAERRRPHAVLTLYCACLLFHRTRMVVRIMLMVPIYAISSLISLFSLDAAFIIDVIRDVYEVRCYSSELSTTLRPFHLGLRNLLLFPAITRVSRRGAFTAHLSTWPPTQSTPLSHERIPTRAGCQRSIHFLIPKTRNSPYVSHSCSTLWSESPREYVQLKPLLAIASLALKASGKFNEGEFRIDSGYLYVSIVYNVSICLSLYCLAMFWLSINEDLKPYRLVIYCGQ